jgi:hypothetical protein
MTTNRSILALEKIEAKAASDIGVRLKEAYDLGRDDMRRELMVVLGAPVSTTGGSLGANDVRRTDAKAPPGTVRPVILAMIKRADGLLTEQILKETGFKENSVRGTLSTLQKQGEIERAAGRWIEKSKGAPAGTATEHEQAPPNIDTTAPRRG